MRWTFVYILAARCHRRSFFYSLCVLLFLSPKMVSRQRQIHYDYWLVWVWMDTKIFYDFAYSPAHATNTHVYNSEISGSKWKNTVKSSQPANRKFGAQALLLKLIAPIPAIGALFQLRESSLLYGLCVAVSSRARVRVCVALICMVSHVLHAHKIYVFGWILKLNECCIGVGGVRVLNRVGFV